MIERLTPPGIPTPRGPYSPAVKAGGFIYVAGQVPVDPATDKMSNGDIQHETRMVLNNIKRILEGCGASLASEAPQPSRMRLMLLSTMRVSCWMSPLDILSVAGSTGTCPAT